MTAVEIVATQDPGAGIEAGSTEMGPVRHLADERARLAGLQWQHFSARRIGATIGAELSGIDLSSAPDEAITEIRQALFDYKVIFFRDQPLTSAQHSAFARRFGELEVHPFIPANTGERELVRFEKSDQVGGYENEWHHDVTWREVPSMAAVLHAVQVPEAGGDTLFADMCAAYDGLPTSVKERIDTLTAQHDFIEAFGRQVPDGRMAEFRERYPLVEHPVVCTHPDTGRQYLYVNRIFTKAILGLSADDGASLIDYLSRQATRIEYQCRFQWTKDAVAMWDNRAVQHYASSDYWPEVRIMERASIIGTRPTR